MKTIGLLGGMSWESSIEYERLINEAVRDRIGGVASADLIIRSYNFAEIEEMQQSGGWDAAGHLLATDARMLQTAGADVIALCTNTMHVVAPAIENAITVPFIHIADPTADAIERAGLLTVGLLGTRYTMEFDFYRGRLAQHGIATVIPEAADRAMVDGVIFDELVRGQVLDSSRDAYLGVIDRLVDEGAEGIVAGCTEVELLVSADDVTIPYFPTTALHVDALVGAIFG